MADTSTENSSGEAPPKKKLLGQMLIDEGHLTEEGLQAALAAQKAGDTRRLGIILVELGHVEASVLSKIISEQTAETIKRLKEM